ncbi:integral membrane sensor signal transduction histidine kinase [Clostridium sp. CAG:389]|nr:integral membrane sensor signal transduction histidine kinase [Clostridium sp. CAG:389]
MEILNLSLILVILSAILITGLLTIILRSKSKNQLQKIFAFDLICVLIISVGVILQEICSKLFNINTLNFEKFIYIGTCFLPLGIYFTGLIFSKTKVTFKPRYLLLCVIPIMTLCILWTNDYHHLFFKYYSTNMSDIVTGPMHTVNAVYSYLLLLLGVFYLLRYSIKNQGLFSKQSILILLGISIPVVLNFLGTCKILPMTVYVTPISFSLSMIFFAFAILKFQFLGATPIALQKIVDRMSDSYLVLNDDGTITDFNQTFITTFKIDYTTLRGQNFEDFSKKHKINYGKIKNAILKAKDSNKTISFEHRVNRIHKIFTVEINTIYSDGASLGTLILFKDITQHIEDMETIKNNQDILMERERLASLGQLIGGIAHNLKTPIMSISGAAEGLTDLVKEYDSSIDDPEVNSQDHHDIAKDMNEWIVKIKEYTEYMSDIITAVKGQAVTLSETENISFDIDELVKRVDILMKHELKNALIYMNVQMKAPKTTKIHGDINSLVQVINNMISNAIQAYNGKTEQNIDLILEKSNGNLIISVKDYGCGLPQKVQDKLFKEMITTKGKNGTGLGLYMSYSTIKAHFNGNITFETEEGKGTTFNIILPL